MSTLPTQSALPLSAASNDPAEQDLLPPQDEQVTAELREREGRIERAQRAAYLEVGLELRAIRDARLYRADFGTFEDYCATRWEFTDDMAQRLMNAAAAAEKLRQLSDSVPARESHIRPLLRLDSDDDRAKVWRMVLDEHPDGHIVAKHVEAAVRAHMGIACEAAAPPPKPAPPPVPPTHVSGKGRSHSPLAMRTDRAHVTDVQPITATKAASKGRTAPRKPTANQRRLAEMDAEDAVRAIRTLAKRAMVVQNIAKRLTDADRELVPRAQACLAGLLEVIENR
jgi:hypothetical protein